MRIAKLQTVYFVTAFMFVGLVQGAEYKLDSLYSLSASYDDNYLYAADSSNLPDDELSGGIFRASWEASRETQTSDIGLSLDVDEGQYNDDAYSRTNGATSLSARQNFSQGWLAADIGASLDTVRSSQLEDQGANQFDVLNPSRVEGQSASLQATWETSELDVFQITVSGQHQRYESNSFRGYEYGSGSLLYQRELTEKFIVQLDVSYSELHSDPDDQPNRLNPNIVENRPDSTDCAAAFFFGDSTQGDSGFDCLKSLTLENTQKTLGGRIGFIYNWNEKLQLDLRVGPQETETESSAVYSTIPGAPFGDSVATITVDGSKSRNESFDITLNYRGERDRLDLRARSSESVTSNGVLNQTQRYSIGLRRNLSKRWSGGGELSYLDSERISENGVTLSDREYFRGEIFSTYALSRNWSIRGRFISDQQERLGVTGKAYRNLVSLTIAWSPNKWSVSR